MNEDNNTGEKPIDLQSNLEQTTSAFANLLEQAGQPTDNQSGDEQVSLDQVDEAEPTEDYEDEVDEAEELDEQYEDDDEDDLEEVSVAELEDDTPVTLQDGTQVTLAELKAGQLRQSDYTKKTQALAEERKGFASEMEKLNAERQAYAQLLPQLQQQLAGEVTPEEHAALEQLRETDPMQYMMAKDQLEQRSKRAEAAQAEMQRVQTAMAEEQQKQFEVYKVQQNELLFEKIPDWKNEEVRKKEGGEIVEFLKTQGYSPEEISQLYDHRGVVMARLAKIGADTLANMKRPPAQKARKVAKAGTTNVRKKSRSRIARENLAKTGTTKAATAVFEQMLISEMKNKG